MWLLVVGNVVEGFVHIGPFSCHDDAFALGEILFGDASEPAWCTAPVQTEAEARADAARVQVQARD
jgi:hypothetical protein